MKMKFASVLLTVICLLGLSAAARADIRGQLRVTMPFAFVIDGQTLPAGTYTLSSFSDDKFDGLILSNHDHRIGVFVRPVEIEGASVDKPQVSFQRVGQQLFLTRIQTAYDVYNIPVPRSAILQLADRSRGNGTASESSSGK
jgi:hypothetical protein